MSISTPFGSYCPSSPAPAVATLSHALIPASDPALRLARHVLILDEDPIACAELGRRLNLDGHSVALACSPTAADELRARLAFDLVIAELQPSRKESLVWLEQLVRTSATPVIVTLADASAESAVPAGSLAIAAVFTKPLDLTVLSRSVQDLFAPLTR